MNASQFIKTKVINAFNLQQQMNIDISSVCIEPIEKRAGTDYGFDFLSLIDEFLVRLRAYVIIGENDNADEFKLEVVLNEIGTGNLKDEVYVTILTFSKEELSQHEINHDLSLVNGDCGLMYTALATEDNFPIINENSDLLIPEIDPE